jgi:hypothetical protein
MTLSTFPCSSLDPWLLVDYLYAAWGFGIGAAGGITGRLAALYVTKVRYDASPLPPFLWLLGYHTTLSPPSQSLTRRGTVPCRCTAAPRT